MSDQEVFEWIGHESVNSNLSKEVKIGRRPARIYGVETPQLTLYSIETSETSHQLTSLSDVKVLKETIE